MPLNPNLAPNLMTRRAQSCVTCRANQISDASPLQVLKQVSTFKDFAEEQLQRVALQLSEVRFAPVITENLHMRNFAPSFDRASFLTPLCLL